MHQHHQQWRNRQQLSFSLPKPNKSAIGVKKQWEMLRHVANEDKFSLLAKLTTEQQTHCVLPPASNLSRIQFCFILIENVPLPFKKSLCHCTHNIHTPQTPLFRNWSLGVNQETFIFFPSFFFAFSAGVYKEPNVNAAEFICVSPEQQPNWLQPIFLRGLLKFASRYTEYRSCKKETDSPN